LNLPGRSGIVQPRPTQPSKSAGAPTAFSVNYALTASPPGGILLPFAVPPGNIGDLTDYPFGFKRPIANRYGLRQRRGCAAERRAHSRAPGL